MSWWQCLVVLCSLVSWGHCQAPGDGSEICLPGGALASVHPVYPNTFKPLMDSRDYRNLLEESDAVWQQVDVDSLGDGTLVTSWSQPTSLLCRQAAYVCGFEEPGQDNWLITQHISREVGGTVLDQVVVVVEFEFNGCIGTGDCTQTFTIHHYGTSTIDAGAAVNVANYGLLDTLAPDDVTGVLRQNATVYFTFDEFTYADTTTGFYLAIRDVSTCVFIHRVLVYYAVCPNIIQDLVNLPETIAPAQQLQGQSEPILVTTGTCVENSSPEFGQPNPEVNCLGGGQWTPRLECVCDDGFYPNRDSTACMTCQAGEYASAGDSSCQPCPNNSNSEAEATVCTCDEGYYRSGTEGPAIGCTQPPSAPQNITVVTVTNTSVYLTWEAPSFNGGRNVAELKYNLSYQRTDGSESEPQIYGSVSGTEGEITGLAPFTEYTVFVSAENGVTSQPGAIDTASDRTVSDTIMTEEGTPSVISTEAIEVDMGSDRVTWPPPRDPGGELVRYDIRIRQNGTDVTTIAVQGTATSFDFATLSLAPGVYEFEIRAVSMSGPGEFSTPRNITVGDNPTDDSGDSSSDDNAVILVVVPLVVVIGIISFGIIFLVIFLLWYMYRRRNYVSSKDLPPAYAYREQIPLPEKPGYRMYIDPTTYTSTDDALQEFAQEIPPKSIRLEAEIGAGEFGTVYRGTWKKDGGKPVAIAVKTLKAGSSPKMREDFLTEASIMGQFDHKNVIKLYGIVTRVEPAMIVMEYMENGSLYTYLRKHDDKLGSYRLVKMARGVASGMNYLARVGYIHRDLAARNILVARDETCKVADFGLSREAVNDEYDVRKGGKIPVRWTAPEAIAYRKFTSSSDVWSFGVLLWELMSYAQHPYEDWDNQTVLDKLEAGIRLHKPKDCPDSVYEVMLECWNAEHTRRPTFEQTVTKLDFLMETNMTASTSNGPRKPPRPSRTKRQVITPLEFETVDDWLRAIKMEKYIVNFQQKGVDHPNRCLQLSEEELQEMAITLPGHIHKIMTSVENGRMQLAREPSLRV